MSIEVQENQPGQSDSQFGTVALTIDPTAPDQSLHCKDQELEADQEPSEREDLQTRIDKIKSALGTRQASRMAVFTVGDVLRKAKEDEISKEDYLTLVMKSGLKSISNADNYIRVAEDIKLRSLKDVEHLPVTVGALIDLVPWKQPELRACIKAGVMHPDVTRSELREWISKHRGKGSTSSSRRLVLEVYTVDAGWKDEDTDAIEQALAQFRVRISLVRPLTPEEKYLKAMGSWYKKVLKYAGTLARARVKAVKKSKGKGNWHFAKDEVDIPPDAGFDRIELVLDTVGLLDEFEGIRESALHKFDQPEAPDDVEAVDPVEQFAELERQIKASKERRKSAKRKDHDKRIEAEFEELEQKLGDRFDRKLGLIKLRDMAKKQEANPEDAELLKEFEALATKPTPRLD